MPIITFKDKPKEEIKNEPAIASGSDEDYMRNISMPVNEEILEEADIDEEVVVTIIGSVTTMRNHKSPDYNDRSIAVRASSIEVTRRNMREEEDDAMRGGYEGEYR